MFVYLFKSSRAPRGAKIPKLKIQRVRHPEDKGPPTQHVVQVMELTDEDKKFIDTHSFEVRF